MRMRKFEFIKPQVTNESGTEENNTYADDRCLLYRQRLSYNKYFLYFGYYYGKI